VCCIQVWYPLSVNQDVPIMMLPPYVPTSILSSVANPKISRSAGIDIINVLYLGHCTAHYSPGAFVRMASMLIHDYCTADTHNVCTPKHASINSGHSFRLHFTMVAVGSIYSSIRSLVTLHGLDPHFTFVHDDSVHTLAAVLSDATTTGTITVMVDPSPTRSSHASVYPMVTLYGVPILRFCSSSANEWLLPGQQLGGDCVHNTTIESLTETLFVYIQQSLSSPHTATAEAQKQEAMEHVKRIYDEQVSALSVQVFLYELVHRQSRSRELLDIDVRTDTESVNLDTTALNTQLPVLNPRLVEFPTSLAASGQPFSPSKYHTLLNQGNEQTQDFRHFTLTAEFMNECLQFDKYSIIQSLMPRLELNLWSPSESGASTHTADSASIDMTAANPSAKRLLCVVYTHVSRHLNVHSQLHTFGKRCDGFVSFSDSPDDRINAVKLNMELEGGESYRNMWKKVQLMWIYTATHWLRTNNSDSSAGNADKYDWVIMMGDDTYVNVPNLKYVLNLYGLYVAELICFCCVERI
jgi:hypothetical protein